MEFIKSNYLIQYIIIIIFLFVSIYLINISTCNLVNDNINNIENYK
jgi:hypothetical protein